MSKHAPWCDKHNAPCDDCYGCETERLYPERLEADRDAVCEAVSLKPGDRIGAAIVLRKDVQNGVFGFWLAGGGFVSLPNAIAKVRPEKAADERSRLRSKLADAQAEIASLNKALSVMTEARLADRAAALPEKKG